MARAAGDQRTLGDGRSQLPAQRARVEPVGRRGELVVRRIQDRTGFGGAQAGLADLAAFQSFIQRGDGLLGVGLHIQAGDDADFLGHRLDVDTGDLGGREHQPAFRGVVAKLRADAQHEVGFGQQTLGRLGGEGAGDADVPFVAREQALALQRRGQQRAGPFAELDEFFPGAGHDGTAAGDDHRAFGGGELFHHFGEDVRSRGFHALRQEFPGRAVFIVPVEVFFLQAHRQVQHDGAAMDAGGVERLGDFLGHVVRAGDRVEAGVAGLHEPALVHHLGAVLGAGLDFAGDHHDRGLAAVGGDQGRAALGDARAAGDHGDADLAGRAGIAVGHRDRHGFMAGRVAAHLGIAADRAPEPHVAIAHQAKEIGDALGNQGLGDRFIDFHGGPSPFGFVCGL